MKQFVQKENVIKFLKKKINISFMIFYGLPFIQNQNICMHIIYLKRRDYLDKNFISVLRDSQNR